MSEDRLNKIEALLAHQEQQIQELSELSTSQWKEIETLKKQLKKTQDKLGALENTVSESGESDGMSSIELAALEKPPHY